jgi:hypothetical protein
VATGQPVTAGLLRFGLGAGIEAAIPAGSMSKGPIMSNDQTTKIRTLNDAFRRTLTGGQILMTSGVNGRGPAFVATALEAVRTFQAFTPDNDPHEEHDFGAFDLDGKKLFWKIDYYDLSLSLGSEDPADASKTKRVLTIMLAEEY